MTRETREQAWARRLAELKAARPPLTPEQISESARILARPALQTQQEQSRRRRLEQLDAEAPEWTPEQISEIGRIFTRVQDRQPGAPSALAEPRRVEPPKQMKRYALYRHYDSEGTLLYIGITSSVAARTKEHIARSTWVEFAAKAEAEWFPDREKAAKAERAAIRAERPLFNKLHNDDAEARLRLVEYLVKHGRLDLLAPAVLRG